MGQNFTIANLGRPRATVKHANHLTNLTLFIHVLLRRFFISFIEESAACSLVIRGIICLPTYVNIFKDQTNRCRHCKNKAQAF